MGPKGKKRNFSLFGDFRRQGLRATIRQAQDEQVVGHQVSRSSGQPGVRGRECIGVPAIIRQRPVDYRFFMPSASSVVCAELARCRSRRTCRFPFVLSLSIPFVLSLSKHERRSRNCPPLLYPTLACMQLRFSGTKRKRPLRLQRPFEFGAQERTRTSTMLLAST